MDTTSSSRLADWTRELDEGCEDLEAGRFVDGASLLAGLKADLAAMQAESEPDRVANRPGVRR